ncbi:MAG TPA: LacI family DNA-binding transcriptional regulator [Streptosporangiaceae bacterium]
MAGVPTVYQVAERAGVSTATVSRVLNATGRVLPQTRDKVLAAVAELGYLPSGAAQDLASRRTAVLGLCFPDLADDQDMAHSDASYWYDEVIRGMERAARRRGYAVLIAASHESDDVRLVLTVAGRCDGLVVLAGTVPVRMLEHIAMRIPVVVLAAGREPGETAGLLDHLSVASETGGYQLTAHLADQHGYQRMTFVAGPRDSPDSAHRFEGFRKAMAERGLATAQEPGYHADFTTAGGRRAASAIFAAPGPAPRALVCANDQMAAGAMAALQAAGLRVPQDVAVAGFDGIQLSAHLRPGLTTVAAPMRTLGGQAVDLITDRIASPSQPARSIQLAVRLVLRGSCGCPEPADRQSGQPLPPDHRPLLLGGIA